MKKLGILLALVGAMVIGNTAADAGFSDSPKAERRAEYNAITVEAAKALPDDSRVTLLGFIEKRLGDDEYLFRDETGTIVVEIDDDDWHGLTVSPQDKVILRGEVDRDRKETKIDVERVEFVK